MIAMTSAVARTTVDYERLLAEFEGAASQFDVLRFLKKVTDLYGARAFIVLKVPNGTANALQSISVITSWPGELMASYDAEGLFEGSPALGHLRTSSLPFAFDIADLSTHRTDGKTAAAVELFERFNMPRGAYFPTCDPIGERGGIGFSGDRAPFSNGEMLELHMLCTYAFDRLYQVARADNKLGNDLKAREIDCLNWTAAGKTSAEISNILSLSEHTVNHYLNRATKKLDTVNRTQAVAKALRMGIIA
jgi:DNA-binding CsgD family transcriptional regulator